MYRYLKHRDTLWALLAIENLKPHFFFASSEYGVPSFISTKTLQKIYSLFKYSSIKDRLLYPTRFDLRVVFHLPPSSIFFNLCTGPQISHSEESLLWLLGRTVLVGGVTRGWPESLGCANSLTALFYYQNNLEWVEAVFANLLLFRPSP